MKDEVGRAARAIEGAGRLVIAAGAGMGVDSGLPDFRGDHGFWEAYPPFARLGLRFVDLANPRWFDDDPELAWGFYGHRLHLYRQAQPHEGFRILGEWAQRVGRRTAQSESGASASGGAPGWFVYTSNVDGQFQRAGFADDCNVECHGSIHFLQCAGPCSRRIWPADGTNLEVDPHTMRALPPLPTCPRCQGVARPNVLMFGDGRWVSDRTDSQSARFERWWRQPAQGPLAIIECGAGTAVPTVRMMSERLACSPSATLIRVNPREPWVPPGQISLPLGAREAIERIDRSLRS